MKKESLVLLLASGLSQACSQARGTAELQTHVEVSQGKTLEDASELILQNQRFECDPELDRVLREAYLKVRHYKNPPEDFLCLDDAYEYNNDAVDVVVHADGLAHNFGLTAPYSFWAQFNAYDEESEREQMLRYLDACANTEGCKGVSLNAHNESIVYPPEVQADFDSWLVQHPMSAATDTAPPQPVLIENPESFNVLLMGKHGTNVDTIILMNVQEARRQITLISVPRDLYYEGRRINAYYARKGIEGQVKAVEEVLGRRIRYHALVDMYDFRDLIDLMGGIDIVLEKDLVDKTYKVKDGDEWGTLDYKAGPHHLNGTEALRIARSRHSSSDFSRAARQQLILKGIKARLLQLGVDDYDAVFPLLEKAHDTFQTDLTVDKMAQFYFTYGDFEVRADFVLSGSNVLTGALIPVSYESARKITECTDDNDPSTCHEVNVIEALLPKNNDWTRISEYVTTVLEG